MASGRSGDAAASACLVVDGARRSPAPTGCPEPSATWRRSSGGSDSVGSTSARVGAKHSWTMTARGPRVVQQVRELLGHVAVVHVEGSAAGLPRAEHALEVLVAVVEVERHVVVDRLPARPGSPNSAMRAQTAPRCSTSASRRVRSVSSRPAEDAGRGRPAPRGRDGLSAIASVIVAMFSSTRPIQPHARRWGPPGPLRSTVADGPAGPRRRQRDRRRGILAG